MATKLSIRRNWKMYADIIFEDGTVYDVRVCEVLRRMNASHDFRDAAYLKPFESKWTRYEAFMAQVKEAVPRAEMSLRDKD